VWIPDPDVRDDGIWEAVRQDYQSMRGKNIKTAMSKLDAIALCGLAGDCLDNQSPAARAGRAAKAAFRLIWRSY